MMNVPAALQAQCRTRAALRDRAKKLAAEERLRQKVESWFGPYFRRAIEPHDEFVRGIATRLPEQETQLMTDIQALRVRVAGLEEKQMKKDEEWLSLNMERNGIEKLATSLDFTLQEQVKELNRFRESLTRERESSMNELTAFMEATRCEMNALGSHINDRLDGIQSDHGRFQEVFEDFIRHERVRTERANDMEHAMREMEERTWPWRHKMDRSCSSSPSRECSPTRNSREQHYFVDSSQAEMKTDWRPWSTCGVVPPPRHASARTMAPCRPSRSSSARGARPPFEKESDHQSSPVTGLQASAGSGLAVARMRQSVPQ
jgi:hypothetical protein